MSINEGVSVTSNADHIERSDSSGNLDELKEQLYNGAVDDRGGEDPAADDGAAEEPASDPSGDPLARELSDEEREGYPEHVRTVADVMKYARELNKYKGFAGNEIGELRKQINDLSQRFAKPAESEQKPSLTPQEYQAMVERGLATDPVNTIQEMLRVGIERALQERVKPIEERVTQSNEAFAERERQIEFDSFISRNNLGPEDLKEVASIMERRMPIYDGNTYFKGHPRRVLEDVWDIMKGSRKAASVGTEVKRAKVISKGSGGIPRQEQGEGELTREDLERSMGLR